MQTILITGGGRGIGRALACQAHERGHNVIVTLRDPAQAASLPPGIRIESLDVTRADQHNRLAERLGGAKVDTLVCNAGVFPSRGGISNATYAEEDWICGMMTNVAGPFFTIRALLPNLFAALRPRIAVISSSMGSTSAAAGGSYIYRASKAAVNNMVANMAIELRPAGIAIAALDPGWVRSDMGTEAAPLDVENSAAGLLERIDEMSLERTGLYEDYLGNAHAF